MIKFLTFEFSVTTDLIPTKLHENFFEKYLNLEGFLEKSLKIKSALKSTGKAVKSFEKSFNSTIFCRT